MPIEWRRWGRGMHRDFCIACTRRDGHEELVRGAVFNELDVRAMRSDLMCGRK